MTPYTHNDFCLLVNKSTSLSLLFREESKPFYGQIPFKFSSCLQG